MKKTLYMIAASLLLFFVLAFMDEYETLILPLLKDDAGKSGIKVTGNIAEEKMAAFLKDFNVQLSAAYSASNPGKAWELPASPQLQRAIHDELVYNLDKKITVKNNVESLTVLRVETLSPSSKRLTVLEISKGDEGGQNESVVAYSVETGEKGFIVTDMVSVASSGERERSGP